ncbi:hypothetical protein [Consotaella salsifontis]|uniref:Lipoprotein n=1 Tax=Consotaella salsifontis TaxID=1365950 RepID=A0A1T4RPG2_9HYPH|nr:hypothetical protein [Consotaella salsifontis]SKA17869.1 hypothetical protein SAMN05428963_107148 [Consotaella salsifontis]
MRNRIVVILAVLALTGCTTAESQSFLPDPSGHRIHRPARVAPRGSEAFCRNYGEQTAQNAYEDYRDDDDDATIARDLIAQQNAEKVGRSAYLRCKQGRLN